MKKSILATVGYVHFALLCDPRQDVFTHIYHSGFWADYETVSGHGSKMDETTEIRQALPKLIKEFQIGSLLDLPCGDFNWMKSVALEGVEYIGADIVFDLVAKNQALYASVGKQFICLDLVKDKLPRADLVLCRDCLVHLPFKDIFAALANLKKSKAKYFLTTTYTKLLSNTDILAGDWRPLNLLLPPFNFPKPLVIIDEKSPSGPDKIYGKSLGLWRMGDIY